MNNLLLITGAGASYDVTNTEKVSVNSSFVPPLTKDLFNVQLGGFIIDCLKDNPLAYQAGLMFYANSRDSNEQSLEQFLRDLKESGELPSKKQYRSIPIYLYDLFTKISHSYLPTRYGGFASNYKALIDMINGSNYDQLLWLNLNYDLFADQAIGISIKNKLTPFKLDDYTSFETDDGKLKIKYTKPHGSVDWVRKMHISGIEWQHIRIGLETVPEDFSEKISEEIYMKYGLPSGKFEKEYYPAISAPVGKDYRFVYKRHMDDIIPDLEHTKDVLCIGFGALDKDILDLLKHVPQILKLKIVNKDLKSGEEAFARIEAAHQDVWERMERAVFNGGFTQFIGKELRKWLLYTAGRV